MLRRFYCIKIGGVIKACNEMYRRKLQSRKSMVPRMRHFSNSPGIRRGANRQLISIFGEFIIHVSPQRLEATLFGGLLDIQTPPTQMPRDSTRRGASPERDYRQLSLGIEGVRAGLQ